MILEVGRYLIKNHKYKNVAKLCDANDRSGVVSDYRYGDTGEIVVSSSIYLITKLANNSPPIQWDIDYLGNDTYKIQNYGHGLFATAESGFRAREKDCVVTVVGGTYPYQWKINETLEKGVYWYVVFGV